MLFSLFMELDMGYYGINQKIWPDKEYITKREKESDERILTICQESMGSENGTP